MNKAAVPKVQWLIGLRVSFCDPDPRKTLIGKEADLISRGILTKKVDHLGTDEIGKLGQDVNSIVTNLSSIVTDMKSDSDTLSTATGEVNTITNTIFWIKIRLHKHWYCS